MTTPKTYALVTGASSGIGADMARALALRGYHLIISARRLDRLQKLKEEIQAATSIDVIIIPKDLSLPGAALELFEQIQQRGLEVEVLINNAGFGIFGPLIGNKPQEIESLLRVNIESLTLLTRYFGAAMIPRKKGFILQVSSVGAFQPCPDFAVYSASKTFVLFLGEALHNEFKKDKVVVTTLCPGITETEFSDVLGQQIKPSFKRLGMTSAEVAQAGLKALFAGKASLTPGIMNKMAECLSKVLSRRAATFISEQTTKAAFKP